MNYKQTLKVSVLLANFKNGIWLLGIPSWLFGIVDRSVAIFTNGYLSALAVSQLLIVSFFFVSWLYLKPENNLNDSDLNPLQSCQIDSVYSQAETNSSTDQARMVEIQQYHIIGQEYILPFSYLCQIYHLLNLKHLETIHNFSLNNLRVIKVSHFQHTVSGGMLKFQTILDSPFNALRIWRPPVVEVGLILHNPYTIELLIPVYNNKNLIVMFNVFPLNANKHKFWINIYSNLDWPRPLLAILLHFASCLTLFEDLPYLRKLAKRNIHRSLNLSTPSHENMRLFSRFVDLYGGNTAKTLLAPDGETVALSKTSSTH